MDYFLLKIQKRILPINSIFGQGKAIEKYFALEKIEIKKIYERSTSKSRCIKIYKIKMLKNGHINSMNFAAKMIFKSSVAAW